MKISIIADIHLNKPLYKTVFDKERTTLPFRMADFMRSFEHMIDENINVVKPDLIVLAGDIYDSDDPSNEIRAFFAEQCVKISKANIDLIVLVGNHDICKKHHALLPLKAIQYDKVTVLDEPCFMKYKGKNLMFFPYSLSVERGDISLKKKFYDFIDSTKDLIEKDVHTLFFGHFGVKGATLKTIEKTEKNIKIKNKDGDNISIEDLSNLNADYIFLGDYHEHQVLSVKNSIAMYTGSIEKSDISESNQKKGYVVYDDSLKNDPVMGCAIFKEYPNCRPMLELKGSLAEILKQIEVADKKNYQNAIVKIFCVGVKNDLIDFSIHLNEIKNKIQDKFNAIYVYMEQKCISETSDKNEKIDESKEEQDSKIIDSGSINEDIVMEVVEEMIKEKEPNEEEQLILIEMARNIYKSEQSL
jgi:DNA repair exonuclease SbcCD nuclease subunit